MLSASRQGHRWFAVVCAIGVALVTMSVSVPAIANEPTDGSKPRPLSRFARSFFARMSRTESVPSGQPSCRAAS